MKKLCLLIIIILLILTDPSLLAQQNKSFSQFKRPIQNDNIKKVTDLINKGENVNTTDKDGTTPLLLAIMLNRTSLAKLFIDAGADIRVADKKGNGCLHYAIQKAFTSEIILTLIDEGIDINALNNEKYSAFHFSLNRCNEFPFMLIAKGANYSAITSLGQNSLHISAISGCDSIFDFLLNKIEQFDAVDNNGDTPFLLALKMNHIHIATELLGKGANVNISNKTLHTPLYYAVENNNVEMFNTLLLVGADINVKVDGVPLLFFAADKNMNMIRSLLENGATIDPLKNVEDYPYKLGLIYFVKADISENNDKLVSYQRSINYFSAAKEDYKTKLNIIRTKQAGRFAAQVCIGVLTPPGSYMPYYGNISDMYEVGEKEYLKLKIIQCDDYILKIQNTISSINQVK